MDTPTKPCSYCGETKLLIEFHKNKNKPDGHVNRCKQCACNITAQWRQDHPGKQKENCKRWWDENKSAYNQRRRQRRQTNSEETNRIRRTKYVQKRETINARRRECYRLNPLPHLKSCKESYDKRRKLHPEFVKMDGRIRRARRRAKLQQVGGTYTHEDIQRQLKAQHEKCYWCGKKLDSTYQVDHVIPIDRGGSNDPGNLVIACEHCNKSKGTKLPHEWEGNGGKLL